MRTRSTLMIAALLVALPVVAQACTYDQSWQECRDAEQSDSDRWLERQEEESAHMRQQFDADNRAADERRLQTEQDRRTYELDHPGADTSLWPHVYPYSR